MNISGLVCAISSRLWGLPPRIDNSFFIFFHKFLADLRRAVELHSGDTSTALARILADLEAVSVR
jgi:hypothetical protein